MAGRQSLAVEMHRQYPQILDWIAQKQSPVEISAKLKPPISRCTIWRYIRDKVKPALQGPAAVVNDLAERGLLSQEVTPNQAMQAVLSATVAGMKADPLLSRIQAHRATVDAKANGATAAGAAALIGADLRGIELEARLTGRLDTGSTQVNIAIVTPAAPGALGPASPESDCVTIDIQASK